jgi:5-carboxymethyl-2-hydroxymuconate isomerase
VPHLTIEYSANLDGRVDMAELCAVASRAILGTGLFELGAVRVRVLRADAYAVADRLPDNAFLDMTFRLGAGRSTEDKKTVGEAIFKAVGEYLAKLFETPHFALSLEVREIDPALSWKNNAMHARLRGK